ncbi:MAG: hypothetical protein JST85_10645 [Acidobacteria bacterium]|nr:hypothetical protein [Acidobacteriota bacterium]
MNNTENQKQTQDSISELTDLNLQEADTNEIKGGPVYVNYGSIGGEVQNAAPTPQTREHILLARQVG